MELKKLMEKCPPLLFKVWDVPNGMFLNEFQNDHGQWLWGRRKDLVGQSSFKWILDHPEDFIVCQYTGVDDNVSDAKDKIFTYDIIEAWSENSAGIRGYAAFMRGNFVLIEFETDIEFPLWHQGAEYIQKIGASALQYPETYFKKTT